jgi:hypothetical protein
MVKIFTALLLAAALAGCTESDDAIGGGGSNGTDTALRCTTPTDPTATLGSTFNLRFAGRSMVLGEGLSLTFGQVVSDNRCAQGTVCVSEGEAEVVIQVVDLQHNPANLDLSTATRLTALGSYHGFDVQLVQVSPYPEFGRAPTHEVDYCVELTVTQP